MEMVGRNVPHASNSRRKQDRVIIDEPKEEKRDYRVLPGVEDEIDLATSAAHVPLIEV